MPIISDGDTIKFHGERIRLNGIDAFESKQSCRDAEGKGYFCGFHFTLALAGKIGAGAVECRRTGTDQYKRPVAVCYLGDIDLNAWMIENGFALAFRRYSKDYIRQEDAARTAKAGAWQGTFVAPWEWRKQQRKRKK